MATDQLRTATTDALQQLLIARVEAERLPDLVGAGVRIAERNRAMVGDTLTDEAIAFMQRGTDERGALIADLDEALEHTSRALARVRNAPVIPLPIPHVAVAEAA